jgi:Holliday junction resolvase RusA-like endonuclease
MDYGWQTITGNVPSKSNCYKIITIAGHSSIAKTPPLKAWENAFYMQCGKYRGLKINTFFEYHCKVFYPSMRTDLDNHCKIVLDAMQRADVITNDNKCVKIVAEKFIDKSNPRIEFKLVTIE